MTRTTIPVEEHYFLVLLLFFGESYYLVYVKLDNSKDIKIDPIKK